MNKIIYNKLVRDKIPGIIEVPGKTCETEILSNEEYLMMLDKNSMKNSRNIMKNKT